MQKDLKIFSEALLLRHYHQTGNNEYLVEAMMRYTPLLYSVSLKYIADKNTAQDIVQNVLLKAMERAPRNIENLGGWLYMITRNECIDMIRSKKKILYKDEITYHDLDDESIIDDVQLLVDISNREVALTEAIQQLKHEQKLCIELFYLHSKSYQDIAAMTGIDIKNVKSQIQNGKRNLKILLSKK